MKSPMPNVQPVLAQLNNMTQPNQNPTFTFELNLEEANIILAALQEIPAKICNPISEKIKAQAQEQINAMQPAEAPAAANEAAAE
jgi:hypothetical protein